MASQSRAVIRKVEFDVTVNTGIFTAGDAMHTGVITIANALQGDNHSGEIISAVVIDQDNEKSALDIEVFNANPSNTTVTVNAALDIADADLDDAYAGRIPVAAADYVSYADNAAATVRNIGLAVATPTKGDRDLYVIVVARGTPTYTATTDLRVKLLIRQD